jgi:hypothetical protein
MASRLSQPAGRQEQCIVQVATNGTGENFDATATIETTVVFFLPDLTQLSSLQATATRWYGTPPHTTATYEYSAQGIGSLDTAVSDLLSQFTGSGSVGLPVQAVLSNFNPGDGPAFLNVALASAGVDVTYTYDFTSVSEPSSVLTSSGVLLLAFGLGNTRRLLRGNRRSRITPAS